jgi:hypothetical protein
MTKKNEVADEVVESLKAAITEGGAKLGMRLATDAEVAALLEDGKEEREHQRAEMDKPEYNDKLKATKDAWYSRARDKAMTLKSLPGFLAELAEHSHDYNTVVYAVAAAALAAARALDRTPHGGITGFQAGGVFWEFYSEWLSEKGPCKMVKYENMLYPQYASSFGKTVTSDTWKWLRQEAAKHLSEQPNAHGAVVDHWRSIVAGTVPFGFCVSDER